MREIAWTFKIAAKQFRKFCYFTESDRNNTDPRITFLKYSKLRSLPNSCGRKGHEITDLYTENVTRCFF